MKTGIELIAAERSRQVTQEGWTQEHDNAHQRGELIDAGLSYIYAAVNVGHPAMQKPPTVWPWEPHWWKPSDDYVRNLVKAGALIAAEIDRITSNLPASPGEKPGSYPATARPGEPAGKSSCLREKKNLIPPRDAKEVMPMP